MTSRKADLVLFSRNNAIVLGSGQRAPPMLFSVLRCPTKVPLKAKGKISKTAMRPATTYGPKCWALNEEMKIKIKIGEMRVLGRTMFGDKPDRFRNAYV